MDTWSLDGTVVQTGSTSYSLYNITANHTVLVTFFSATTYPVTPTAGVNGAISPSTRRRCTPAAA